MKALVGAFNQEEALVGAFYVISCGPSSEALHWIRVMDRAHWPHGTQQLVYSLGGGRYELGTEEK